MRRKHVQCIWCDIVYSVHGWQYQQRWSVHLHMRGWLQQLRLWSDTGLHT